MYIDTLPLGDVSANCYILCDEETKIGALVDVGGFSPLLIEKIKESGMKELKYILLTHGHFDHISGVNDIKKHFPQAEVIISEKDALLTSDESKNGAAFFGALYSPFTADILAENGEKIKIGNTEFEVLETAGHTRGSVCFVNKKEKFMFSGDTLFKYTVGRTDLFGGSDEDLKASIKKLLEFSDDYTVYTGHNIATTIGSERTRNIYIRRLK